VEFQLNGDWISKEDGGLTPYFNLDELLDNVMIYWVTNSITTSMRFYSESFLSPREGKHDMHRYISSFYFYLRIA
jgi:hypothetical protein